MHLFCQHGVGRVTFARITVAGNVCVKTVVNYFEASENLFFARRGTARRVLGTAVQARPPGTTVITQLDRLLADRLVPVDDAGWEAV